MNNYTFKTYSIEEYYKIKDDVDFLLNSSRQDKLKNNYTIENFFKDNPLYISIIYKDNKPYECSTVITRNIFSNGCRVLNRLILDSTQRDTKISKKIPFTTLSMLQQQLNLVKNNFDFAFISREFNTYRFCKRFSIDCNNFFNYKWQYETKKYLVCNWEKGWQIPATSCFQWIAWTKFKEIDIFPLPTESSLHLDIYHKT